MSEETAFDRPIEDPEAERLRWLAKAKSQPKKKNQVACKRINKKGDFDLSALSGLDETSLSNFQATPSKTPSRTKSSTKPKQKKIDVDDMLSNLSNLTAQDFPELSLPTNVEADDLLASLTSHQPPEIQNVNVDSLLASLNGFGSDDNNQSLKIPKDNSETDLASLLDSPGEQEVFSTYNNHASSNNSASKETKESEGESRAAWNLLSLFSKKPSGTSGTSPSKEPKSKASKLPTGSLKYGIKDDMNKSGLKRVKKPQIKYGGKGKAKLQMEDMHVAELPYMGEEKRGLFGVFDGHVDKNAAVSAKSLFPREFEKQIRSLKNLNDCKDLTEVFRTTFNRVDSLMSEFEFEGTTATVAFIWQAGEDRYLQVANVGDSTAFLCRNGTAVFLSSDHKITDPGEIARLKEGGYPYSEGQTRINGLAVSRALGDHFLKQNNLGVIVDPYISEPHKLGALDSFIIIASDGLWDTMTGQEAVDLIKDMDQPEKMARKLVLSALHSSKCTDNITVIVINL